MRCDDSEMVAALVAACDLRWQVQSLCLSHLEAGARAPAGRTPQRAVAPARPGAAGRQSPWQLDSHPGSSPRGS